jgi:hypothetical protein
MQVVTSQKRQNAECGCRILPTKRLYKQMLSILNKFTASTTKIETAVKISSGRLLRSSELSTAASWSIRMEAQLDEYVDFVSKVSRFLVKVWMPNVKSSPASFPGSQTTVFGLFPSINDVDTDGYFT